jgi:hypothetical protein
MKRRSRREFLALINRSEGAFEVLQNRKQVALAFGAEVPATYGGYFDVDAAAMLVSDGLAAAMAKHKGAAAALVRLFGEQLLDAIGRAEFDRRAMFFAIGETQTPEGIAYTGTCGTLAEIAADFDEANPERIGPPPARLLTVNVTDVLARIRANARAAGIDLSDPLFLPPGHPEYARLIEQAREVREAAIARQEQKAARLEARA